MGNRPWHKRFHGDAITGYMGLSLEERGAYSTLLDHLYDRGCPLLDNMRLLAGLLDVSVRKAETVIENLIKKGKLYRREDGKISNHRFEKEAENDAKTSDHMAMIGSDGGRKSAYLRKKSFENNDAAKRALEPRSSYLEPELEPERKKEVRKKGAGAPAAVPSQAIAIVTPSELDLAVQAFNEGAERSSGGIVAIKQMPTGRQKLILARLKEVGLDGWRAAVVRAVASDFLSGRARRSAGHEGWKMDAGWFAKAENFAKLAEGKYDNRTGAIARPRGMESIAAGMNDFLQGLEEA